MHLISGKSINEIALAVWQKILNEGGISDNRNSSTMGGIKCIYDCSIVLENPRARHLSLDGRKNNIFAVIGEMFWVMAGREDTEYLLNFIPRANDFSDDGKTWRAAYGSRMYEYGQLQSCIDKFIDDGLYTRQAMFTLWHPEKDTKFMLKEKYNLEKTKDTPCNQWVQFWVDVNTHELNMKVIQRSGDAIWGTLNINLPEFSLLHEFVLQQIQKTYPQVILGKYHHSVTNLHIYDATSQQAIDAVSNPDNFFTSEFVAAKSVFPETLDKTKIFFNDICEFITSQSGDIDFNISRLNTIFEYHNVKKEDNLLYVYAYLTRIFIVSKRNGFKKSDNSYKDNVVVLPNNFSEFADIMNCVKKSPFLNFTYKYKFANGEMY